MTLNRETSKFYNSLALNNEGCTLGLGFVNHMHLLLHQSVTPFFLPTFSVYDPFPRYFPFGCISSQSPNGFYHLPILIQLLMSIAGPFTIRHLGLLSLTRTHQQPIVSLLLSSPPSWSQNFTLPMIFIPVLINYCCQLLAFSHLPPRTLSLSRTRHQPIISFLLSSLPS